MHNIQMRADWMLTVKLHWCLPHLPLLRVTVALWWLPSWNCMLLSGATLKLPFSLAPSGSGCTNISCPLQLSRRRCGLAAFRRLGFSFLWLGHSFSLLCFLCLT